MTTDGRELTQLSLRVNGSTHDAKIDPAATLQFCLHHALGFKEVRNGCSEGVCGACTVLIDGEPRASCLMLGLQAEGKEIVTSAGLDQSFPCTRAVYDQLVARQAFQCGYCSCGILVSAVHHVGTSNDGGNNDAARKALSGHLCRCTGYRQILDATIAAAKNEPPPTDSYPRVDLQEKLSGAAGYPTDRQKDAPLVGRILWSDWPSARINSIDIEAAKAIPGVVAVLTYKDIPGSNFTGSRLFREEQPLLASNEVKTMADAVALVAARDETAAEQALASIRVRYEPLTPLTDLAAAALPDAPKVGKRGNIIAQVIESRGNVDSALATADFVVEGDYATTINDHSCIELEGGTGWVEGDVLVLSLPHQTPDTGQKNVARMLKIPTNRVRIEAVRLGGSFGKYMVSTIEGYLALLVYRTQQPVRLVLGRKEILQRRTKRHPTTGHYTLGLKRDGTILALKADILADAGAYENLTPAVAAVLSAESTGAYHIPNVYVRARGVLTNNLVTAAMRGYGSQQITFGVESIVEKGARSLGMDPAELRIKNFKHVREGGKGQPVSGANLVLGKTMERVRARLGPRPEVPPGWTGGRGVASVHAKYGFPYGFVDRFVVRVSVDETGRFTVESDISDSGTSVGPELTRLLATTLGLSALPSYVISRSAVDDPSGYSFDHGKSPSKLRVAPYRLIEWIQGSSGGVLLHLTANMNPALVVWLIRLSARPTNLFLSLINRLKTALFPYNRDSFQPRFASSRAMTLCGVGLLAAVDKLKETAIDLSARSLNVPATELEVESRGVTHKNSSRLVSWGDLAKLAGGQLSAIGDGHNPPGQIIDPATGSQRGPVDFMDASHGCDLAIHPETGQVRILKYVACHDAGRVLNYEGARGQVIGGAVMGMGQALFERITLHEGKVTPTGFRDYLVPTALDTADELEVELLESGSGIGPGGAKGMGESGAVASPIAIANAIYDALGTQLSVIPVTPEELAALAEGSHLARAASAKI